jgi:hypothetical protein
MKRQLVLKYEQRREFFKSLFEEVDEAALIQELARLFLRFSQTREKEGQADERAGE